jgi:hypothetical protein
MLRARPYAGLRNNASGKRREARCGGPRFM